MTMSAKFIEKLLEPGEHKVAHSSLHPIYLVNGLCWFLFLCALGWGADFALWHYLGSYVPEYEIDTDKFQFGLSEGWIGWLFTASAATILLTQIVKYISTDIMVTTKRFIYKRGLIKTTVYGTDISDIRAFTVDQGWLGQFLNYGKIHMDCRFVADIDVPFTKYACDIVKHMEHIKTRIENPPHHDASYHDSGQTIIQIIAGEGGKTKITHPSGDTLLIESENQESIPAAAAKPVAKEA